jgi:hypothetical protein
MAQIGVENALSFTAAIMRAHGGGLKLIFKCFFSAFGLWPSSGMRIRTFNLLPD